MAKLDIHAMKPAHHVKFHLEIQVVVKQEFVKFILHEILR